MTIVITPEFQSFLDLLTDPTLSIPDTLSKPAPAIATIREVDITVAAGKIDAKFVKANYEVDLGDAGGLGEVLRKVANGSISMPDSAAPKPPYETPLSLNNEKYCYVILKLSGKNWQFSREGAPFSVGIDGWIADVYRRARRVDAQGTVVDPTAIQDGCKVAYLIADGQTASGGTPRDYRHPFNLHVDLIYQDSATNPSHMPIIIDPDIRWPGGSGP